MKNTLILIQSNWNLFFENIDMNKKILALLFGLIAAVGCTNRTTPLEVNDLTQPEIINIKEIPLSKPTAISQIFNDFNFLPLETNSQSILGGIDRMLFTRDHIYILDWLVARDIFIFSRTGQFITNLGSLGKGPGEFTNPTDFFLTPTGQIGLLDNGQFVHYYEFDNKNIRYIKSKEIPPEIGPFEVANIDLAGTNLALIAGFKNPNLCITDETFSKTSFYFPYLGYNFSIGLSNGLNRNNNTLLYRRYLNDTIFKIVDTMPIPHKIIHFDNNISLSQLIGLPQEQQKEQIMSRSKINMYFEHSDTYYFKYSKNSDETYLIKTKDGTLIHLSKSDLKNDVYGSKGFYCIGVDQYTDSYIFITTPANLMNIIETKPEILHTESLNKIKNLSLKEDDNYVLVMLKM